jgi:hypothetical protein
MGNIRLALKLLAPAKAPVEIADEVADAPEADAAEPDAPEAVAEDEATPKADGETAPQAGE